MIRQLFGDIPEWMRSDNPLLRYELKRRLDTSESRLGRITGWVMVLSVLILGGVLYATNGLQRGFQMPISLDIWNVVIFPLILVQLVMRIAGLSLGIGAINDERQRQTWDNLRATEQGAELSLRTRWVSVFHRLRGLLFTVMTARIILIGAILYDLTSMQGQLLDLLAARAVPAVSAEVGIIILAGFMTAFIMMPLTAMGVDIALGLFISTSFKSRSISMILQILIVAFRVATTALLFWGVWQFTNGSLELNNPQALGVLSGFSILGDWGVVMSHLSAAGELWATVPHTIFIGLMMLAAVITQIAITSGLLAASVKAAEIRE